MQTFVRETWHSLSTLVASAFGGQTAPDGAGGYIPIQLWQLALASGFVLCAMVFSMRLRLKLERDLAIGTVRVFLQLFAVGWVLQLVFANPAAWMVAALFTLTICCAATIAGRSLRRHRVALFWPVLAAIGVSSFTVTFTVCALIIQASPWWEPQYFIPIGGMVAGNCMNALTIALERFFAELRQNRPAIEALLCLGASPREASQPSLRTAMRAGMLNPVNAMMGVGIVTLPGMMTGQILAGVQPMQAIRYQIVVILMLTTTAALSTYMALRLVQGRCFTDHAALKRFDGQNSAL